MKTSLVLFLIIQGSASDSTTKELSRCERSTEATVLRSAMRAKGPQDDHPLRQINRLLDLSFVQRQVAHAYGRRGFFCSSTSAPLKDRPGIKTRLVGPPETPSVSIFLNWQVNQQMGSAFLPPSPSLWRGRPSSTLVGRNATLERECNLTWPGSHLQRRDRELGSRTS